MNQDQVPKGGWRRGRDSFTKMVVFFKDGNRIHRYSDDWKGKYNKSRDREYGLSRLYNLLASYGNNPKTVLFYDLATDTQFKKFVDGQEVDL